VVAGALSDRARTSAEGVAYTDFLRSMYDAGAGGHFDGLSVHIYPRRLGLAHIETVLSRIRALRDSRGTPGLPLWVTELGVSSTGPDPGEERQAELLVQYQDAVRAQPDVRARIVHTLIEPPGSLFHEGPGFGILRPDLSPKPAYCALAVALATGTLCPPDPAT
jgi:hypothetical protein